MPQSHTLDEGGPSSSQGIHEEWEFTRQQQQSEVLTFPLPPRGRGQHKPGTLLTSQQERDALLRFQASEKRRREEEELAHLRGLLLSNQVAPVVVSIPIGSLEEMILDAPKTTNAQIAAQKRSEQNEALKKFASHYAGAPATLNKPVLPLTNARKPQRSARAAIQAVVRPATAAASTRAALKAVVRPATAAAVAYAATPQEAQRVSRRKTLRASSASSASSLSELPILPPSYYPIINYILQRDSKGQPVMNIILELYSIYCDNNWNKFLDSQFQNVILYSYIAAYNEEYRKKIVSSSSRSQRK